VASLSGLGARAVISADLSGNSATVKRLRVLSMVARSDSVNAWALGRAKELTVAYRKAIMVLRGAFIDDSLIAAFDAR
jgi:hypothetical protein